MIIVNKNTRLIGLILTIFLVLVGINAFQIASSSPAHASESTCASTGSCQDISTGVALRNSGSGGGGGSLVPSVGGGGGGGFASAPAIPSSCDPNDSTMCADDYITRSTFFPISGGRLIMCPTKMINGIKVDAVGNTLVEIAYRIDWGNPNDPNGAYWSNWQFLDTVCNYPPDPTNVQTNVKCILSFTASVDRLSNSYAGAGTVGSTSQTVATLSSLEKDPSGCQDSIDANFGTNLGRSQAEYGWYQASSQVTWANCNFGTITFDGVSTRTGGCNDAGTLGGSIGKLTIYCGGDVKGAWISYDWTGKDCYSSGPNCSVPNNSTFNGFTGNVQALRDGNDNNMTWANPNLSAGISGADNWRTKTDINAGSTPYKDGVGPNDTANQMFRSNQPFGSWYGGSLSSLQDQKIAFYTSGSSGSPFSMTRNYLFDANFTTIGTIINGYNVTTGAISTSHFSTTTFLRNNPCGPQSSPNINAVRAIGDVITK